MQLGNGPPMTIHLHVDTFERLPLNDDTSKLLAIATGPDTKVTVHTAEEMRERERRAREGCEPLPDGSGERCPPPATDEAP
jgi:hypothetical protein